MATTEFEISRNDEEIELVCVLTYVPECKGSRGDYGRKMEPDYPATFEINSVKDLSGREIQLTQNECDSLIEKALSEREN